MSLLDLRLLGTELRHVLRQRPGLHLRDVQRHRLGALRDGPRRGALHGAVLPRGLEDAVGVLPRDLLLRVALRRWRWRLGHLRGLLPSDGGGDHLLHRQVRDQEHWHGALGQVGVDLDEQRLGGPRDGHVDGLEVHLADGDVVPLEEAEELLPIVVPARGLRAVLEGMHGQVLRRVVPGEDLRDEEAVREVALRVADAVRQV
mmetsp:Transcript_12178/g.34798  ORF Transcript_12178/g.34798 Transcript_12178/m.34798 type:complete len:202 (-) Transcript_12178:443-1048(-)